MSEKSQQSEVPDPPAASPAPETTPNQVTPQPAAEDVELTDDQLGQVSGGAGGDVAMGAARNLR